MVNQEVLLEYSNSIRNLKKECTEAGMTDEEFKKIYFDSLKSLEGNENLNTPVPQRFIRKHKILLFGIIIALCILYNYKYIYSTVVCNLQEFIYPGLRLLRRISIPIISLFPALTDYYHESCLIQNPFFTVADMDCWPCSSVGNIREVTDLQPVMQEHSAPFIYETEQKELDIKMLKELYQTNKPIFDKESPKIFTNNKYYLTPSEMFIQMSAGHGSYYVWKFNNMNEALALRQLIPRPKVVPKFGQSTERFLIIDSSEESYRVPDTECSFSFLLSLSGSRTIVLVPAEECKHQCKSLRVELKETYLLWYNWWYWRPVVQPTTGNSTFIGHVGSYC